MKIVTKAQLYKEFPEFFVVLRKEFGVECGKGWYGIIRDCCKAVKKELVAHKVPLSCFEFHQIKEKFGLLRLYGGVNNSPVSYKGGKVWRILLAYERPSAKVCEFCGKKGRLRPEHSWVKTLCDGCNAKEGRRLKRHHAKMLKLYGKDLSFHDEEPKECKTCYGFGLWAMGNPSPMGPMDAADGMPTLPCPSCGACKNPVKGGKK